MADVAAKVKKTQVAIRDWIDAHGTPLASGSESDVAGIRYIHLTSARRANPDYNPETDPAPKDCSFEVMFGDDVKTRMLAAFGAQTLAGNIASTTTNPKNPKGDPDANPIPFITERFDDIANGIWCDREGGVGVRYDKDKLVQAVLAAKRESDPAPYVAKLESKVDAKTGAVVAADTKGAISWGAFALKNPTVKGEYDKLTGSGVSLNQI